MRISLAPVLLILAVSAHACDVSDAALERFKRGQIDRLTAGLIAARTSGDYSKLADCAIGRVGADGHGSGEMQGVRLPEGALHILCSLRTPRGIEKSEAVVSAEALDGIDFAAVDGGQLLDLRVLKEGRSCEAFLPYLSSTALIPAKDDRLVDAIAAAHSTLQAMADRIRGEDLLKKYAPLIDKQ